MIKVESNHKKAEVSINGTAPELLTELAAIITDFLEEDVADEELIDIAVGLAKAKHKGNLKKYMKDTMGKAIMNKLMKDLEEFKDEIED